MPNCTNRLRIPNLALIVALIAVAGCAHALDGNQPRAPNRDLPGAYAAPDPDAVLADAAPSVARLDWETLSSDPQLASLINEALENNQELNMQVQEIIIARAEVGARKGEYLPKLDGELGLGVERVGGRTSQGVSDEAHAVPANLGDFRFGLRTSWELDVWGKLRNGAKAADLRYRASIEARNFLVTELVAEIAEAYYELIAIDRTVGVLDTYVELTQQALEATRAKKEAGRATKLAVQRFEAELSKANAHVFEVKQGKVITTNRINFLVGRYPQPVAHRAQLVDEETLARVNKTGIPTDLLENRPDVRRAELELEAAELDSKAAKANFYPSLSIDASVGYESFNIAHLLATPQSLAYGVAGSLVAPLLNRKAIKAEYQTANAKQIRAVLRFEQSLLGAFTEVANQLATLDLLSKRRESVATQVETLDEAVEVSNILYGSARADYMEVLLTRRDALDAQLDLIEIERSQMQGVVGLYQALGGGWRTRDENGESP